MSPSGLWWRALLAVALMIGFYAMALGIVAFCYGVSAALVLGGGSIPVKLIFILVLAGSVVLWSVIPRWDSFTAPGPRLEESEHPRLFGVLQDVARATGQPMPSDVYVVDDVNAFVTNRGGWMGFGSRPVMGIGLPLLQSLSVDEMRAVIAHEFGHYVGGDTRLGPWLYKTRTAIIRSLENLATAGSLLVYPFALYLRLFLRVSHAVSRHQEFLADQVGVRVAGAAPLGSALRKVRGIAPAFGQYWRDEVVPVLLRGRRPPVAAGFAHFLSVPSVAAAVRKIMVEVNDSAPDPYDTHPPLAERLRAIGAVEQAPVEQGGGEPAISLLGDVNATEVQLVRGLLHDDAPEPEAISWAESGPFVYAAQWREVAAREPAVRAESIASLPSLLRDPRRLGEKFAGVKLPEERKEVAHYVASVVIGRTLVGLGWTVNTLPGEPIRLENGDHSGQLVDWVLAAETESDTAWATRWAAMGIEGAAFSEPFSG